MVVSWYMKRDFWCTFTFTHRKLLYKQLARITQRVTKIFCLNWFVGKKFYCSGTIISCLMIIFYNVLLVSVLATWVEWKWSRTYNQSGRAQSEGPTYRPATWEGQVRVWYCVTCVIFPWVLHMFTTCSWEWQHTARNQCYNPSQRLARWQKTSFR